MLLTSELAVFEFVPSVKADGRKHVWVPPYTGKEGYLHAESSDVSGYKQWKNAYPDGASATEESASMSATGEIQVGSSFITAPLGDNVTLENSNWQMAIWSYLTGGTAYLRAKIYRYRDAVETLLFTTSDSPAVGTSYSKINWTYQAVGTFELLPTDRLVVKIFANITVKSAGKKIYIAYDHSTRDSLVVDPSFLGTSTTSGATAYPFQRKTFYDWNVSKLFWAFYSDGTNMVANYSSDGTTWYKCPQNPIRACTTGYGFSVWFDGTYLHYAFANGGKIYYRRGTPNSDGSITWSADEQTVSTTYNYASYPVVSVDSNGYVWIGYRDYDGASYYPYVVKSGNNDGTWGTGTITQLSTTASSYWRVSVVPLTSGKMLAIYSYDGTTVRAEKWDGSAWGSEVATTSTIYTGHYHSAVAQGDDVHLVFLKSSGYDILYVKYTYSTNSFGTETTLQAGATIYSAPVISIDTATNDLYVFAATKATGTPSGWTADHIYYKKYTASSGTWGSWTDWIDESSTGTNELLYSAGRLTCFYQSYGSKIGLEYMTKTASPYNVKFAYLSLAVADTTPPTYSNIATNTTVAGQPCQFSVLWNDNVNVSGYIFGTNNTGAWVNETWVSFTVFYNSTAAWSNVTKTLNSTVGVRVEWQFWVNDTSSNWNATGIQYLITTGQTYNRAAAQPLSLLASPSRMLTLVRQPFQSMTLSAFASRVVTLFRASSMISQVLIFTTAQKTVARLPTLTLTPTAFAERILQFQRSTNQLIQLMPSTIRTLSAQRQTFQAFSISSLASRLVSLSRTQSQQIMLIMQAGRTQAFVRLASTTISGQTSATRWQQAIRQATSQIQALASAFGEKKGFYERLLQLTITISSSATRIIQLQRFNTQSLTITTIASSFKISSRTATSNIMLLLSTVTQKISFGIQRTADLSITVNAVAQRTHLSITRMANALFQAIISVNRWVFPLYEGIPSGPITTPHFEITVESFTYSLNVFQNNLETKALIKFQPLNSFDGNVTINVWITNTAETETFASKNLTIPFHASDHDPTQYTLTLDTLIFWTAITNDHLIWHMNAQYNNQTTGESRVFFTPIPWLTTVKPFSPYALICLALVAIYIVFFKLD